MTVLVSGATSQIGRFLLPRLVQAHGRVQAVSRQPQPAQDGVQWLCGDLAAALDSVPSPDWQAIASFGPLKHWRSGCRGRRRPPRGRSSPPVR